MKRFAQQGILALSLPLSLRKQELLCTHLFIGLSIQLLHLILPAVGMVNYTSTCCWLERGRLLCSEGLVKKISKLKVDCPHRAGSRHILLQPEVLGPEP